MKIRARGLAVSSFLVLVLVAAPAAFAVRPFPILFVTQVPIPNDDQGAVSVFANHQAQTDLTPRGGDLWILYPDNTLKNLTAAAGYGVPCSVGTLCFEGASSIAVREPSMHWSGTKAVFSMVIGAPTAQHVPVASFWQLYEITGLGQAETPVISKVPNQPAGFNNVSPFYGTDERILFTSDRPRSGEGHLYPQLDEYKSQPTVTGLWSLDPPTGDLRLLNHTVSGLFGPILDSFGRIVFTRWDHLQRDSQADRDFQAAQMSQPPVFGTFDYANETANAPRSTTTVEIFPEPQSSRTDLLNGTNVVGMEFNQFFPWVMNEDGTSEEIINHAGRHDFRFAIGRAFNDNPELVNLSMVSVPPPPRTNQNFANNFLQLKESPTVPGRYFGVDATENGTHGGGQIVQIDAPPTSRPDLIPLTWWTDRSGSFFFQGAGPDPNPSHTGHYRNPLPLSDGTLIASHAAEMRADANQGTRALPVSLYAYRLKTITGSPAVPSQQAGAVAAAGAPLTPGIVRSVWWWDPDVAVTYNNVTLWELDPVEVRSRPKPVAANPPLGQPEQDAFTLAGVSPTALKNWMAANDVALIVSHNLTTRDGDDRQQPFNLRVKKHDGTIGTTTTATSYVPGTSHLYDVTHLEIFQADQLRGLGGTTNPRPGRRPLARPMHDAAPLNPPNSNPAAPSGAVELATDGSMAAFVPAHRALSWQLSDDTFTPVVHERYWLTFQPGEIRVCTSCHGMSHVDQAGHAAPNNLPMALRNLLEFWKTQHPAASGAPGFYAITPCRVLDSRLADGAGGGPPLAPHGARLYRFANRCGLPASAKAVSINVTVTQPASPGFFLLYPSDGAAPLTSTLNFSAGQTRTNNAILSLSNDGVGALKIQNGSAGSAQVIVDVNGYFQ